jgi:hypothetical protein
MTANNTLWIMQTVTVDDDDVAIYQEPAAFREDNLDFGLGLPQRTRASTFQVVIPADQTGTLNDALDLGGGLLVSPTLRTAIESTGITNIEWFPVTVHDVPRNERRMGYSLANVLGTVRCVDFAHSKLQLTPSGSIKFIDSLVLLPEAIGPTLMVRIAEFLPLIVVREPIKRAVEAARCRGIEFVLPQEIVL